MPLPTRILSRINCIETDNLSGAEALMLKSAELFLWLAGNVEEKDPGKLFVTLCETAKGLVNAQPAMAGIFNVANKILLAAEGLETNSQMHEAIIGTANGIIQSSSRCLQEIAANASRLLQSGQTVITHSFSSTVFLSLSEAKESGKDFTVICTESRPMMEGVTLARQLARSGIQVKLVTDAAMCGLLHLSDLVFLGADSLGTEGLINKIGSMPIAVIARRYNVPCYTLCSTHKFVPPGHRLHPDKQGNTREIFDEQLPNITPLNPYFDLTPLEYLHGVVTEKGVRSTEAVKEDFDSLKIHPFLS